MPDKGINPGRIIRKSRGSELRVRVRVRGSVYVAERVRVVSGLRGWRGLTWPAA